jgi:hypothetical protein
MRQARTRYAYIMALLEKCVRCVHASWSGRPARMLSIDFRAPAGFSRDKLWAGGLRHTDLVSVLSH